MSAPTPLHDLYFDSAGVPIRYVLAGDGGDPVVLLHSYSTDLDDLWVKTGVLHALAREYRVAAFDWRGHGRSGKPHDPRSYGREMTLDTVRLLDHLGWARAHVVGYSLGGHLAAQLMALHPERFITATLGGAAGRREWTPQDAQQAEIEAAAMEQGSLAPQMLRLWPAGKPQPTAATIERASAKFLAGKDCRALAAVRRSNAEQVVSAADIAAASVPTLGIVGSGDPYLAAFEALRRSMPDMELVVIEGATHASAPQYPEFVEVIRKFLRQNPGQTTLSRSTDSP